MKVKDFYPGGGGTEGIRELFQSGSAGGVAFWGKDVGSEPSVWSGT